MGDQRKQWAIVKEIAEGSTESREKLLRMENAKDLTSGFNRHFLEIGVDLTNVDKTKHEILISSVAESAMLSNFTEATFESIGAIIMNLKSRAPGPDGIDSEVLKILFQKHSTVLRDQINKSIKSKNFPENQKIAKIIPIHKKGDIDITVNYRLISLLNSFSKVI